METEMASQPGRPEDYESVCVWWRKGVQAWKEKGARGHYHSAQSRDTEAICPAHDWLPSPLEMSDFFPLQ